MMKTQEKLNTQALIGLVEYLKNSVPGSRTSHAKPGQVLPVIKGYTFVPLEVLRAALMLPHRYKNETSGRMSKYTVADCVKIFLFSSSCNSPLSLLFDIELRKTLYHRDACFIRLNCSPDEVLQRAGLVVNEDDNKSYAKYLKKRARTKANQPGYSLFELQKDSLIDELKKTTSLPDDLLESWLLVHTTFADNRVFHPLINMKKEQRRKKFKHEMDMVSSQVTLLSKLVKDVTERRSEFTNLVDKCLESGQDIYEELAAKDGFDCSSRGAAKEHVLKSLFNGSDTFIWQDKGVQSMLLKLKETKEYKVYVQSTWMSFVDIHCAYMTVSECKRKFEKLFLRRFLTSLELTVMTMAAQILHSNQEKFITVHDAFCFPSAPSKESIKAIDKLSSDLGVKFCNKSYGN